MDLYAEYRRLFTGMFNLQSLRPADRIGDDPQRFDLELRALGADLDRDDPGPLGIRGLFQPSAGCFAEPRRPFSQGMPARPQCRIRQRSPW